MKRLKNYITSFYEEYKVILMVLILVSLVSFYDVIFFGKAFAWDNDQTFQYNIFYKEWFNIIKESINNKNLSFYSWNTFLGTDFYVSKLFTVVGDLLALVVFVLFKDVNFNLFFCVETILCILCSGVTMNIYLKKMKIQSQKVRNSFSIVYSLSGFSALFAGTYMFHRFYAILPLLFYFVEKYLQDNKLFGFSIIVAILFLQNYELMFSTSIFLVLYFFVSNYLKEKTKTLEILKKSLPLVISYAFGILLVGFALIPLLFFLKSNPRVGDIQFGGFFWSFQTIVGFISNIFTNPFSIYNGNPPYLFFSDNYQGSQYSFYITPIIVFSILVLIKKGTKNEITTFLVSEFLIMVFALVRPLNMIIHGFSAPTFRWLFLLVFLNILISSYVLDKYTYDKTNTKKLTSLLVIYMIMLFIMMYICGYSFKEYGFSLIVLIILAMTLYVYDFLLYRNIKFALTFMIINVCFMFVLFVYCAKTQRIDEYKSFNQEFIDYYKGEDEDVMYRYYFDPLTIEPYSSANLNSGLKYNYQSTTSYDSAYENVLNDFLIVNNYNGWAININNKELLKMLGVKYLGITSNQDLLEGLDTNYAYNLDNIEIYQIKDYNSIGHTYSKFESEIENVKDWNNELYVEDMGLVSDITPANKAQLRVIEYNRQYMKASIDVSSKQVLMIAIPYSTGWNVYNQKNEKLNQIKVQGGFLGLIIDERTQEINMYYQTPGLKVGIILSTVGFIGLIVLFIKDRKQKEFKI